jgi:hypothetical protein
VELEVSVATVDDVDIVLCWLVLLRAPKSSLLAGLPGPSSALAKRAGDAIPRGVVLDCRAEENIPSSLSIRRFVGLRSGEAVGERARLRCDLKKPACPRALEPVGANISIGSSCKGPGRRMMFT